MNRIYLLLLALLGFAGCGVKDGIETEDDSGNQLVMYGTPYAEYTVKGRVTDAAGRPIAGIEVQTNGRAAVTDPQGAYTVAGRSDILARAPFVTFTDTDGPANGGDFAARQLEVRFSESDRTGQREGSWMYGRFERAGVDAVLEPESGKE